MKPKKAVFAEGIDAVFNPPQRPPETAEAPAATETTRRRPGRPKVEKTAAQAAPGATKPGKVKCTYYLDPAVVRPFRILAIELGVPASTLAEQAFRLVVQKNKKGQ